MPQAPQVINKDCLFSTGGAQSHVLFSPIPCQLPMTSTKGKSVSISGITSKDRRSLRMLLIVLGFKYSESLTPTVDYLITNPPLSSSKKCLCAKEWNIPLIHQKWILQSAQMGSLLPLANFYLLPNLPAPKVPVPKTTQTTYSPNTSPMSKSTVKTSKTYKNRSPTVPHTPLLLGTEIYVTNRVSEEMRTKIEEICEALGAALHLKLSQDVTHVIDQIVTNPSTTNSTSLSAAKIKATYPSIKIVSSLWLEETFKSGTRQNEDLFPPVVNPKMKLHVGKNPPATQTLPPRFAGHKRTLIELLPEPVIPVFSHGPPCGSPCGC